MVGLGWWAACSLLLGLITNPTFGFTFGFSYYTPRQKA